MDETLHDDWRSAPPGYAYAPPAVPVAIPARERYGPYAHRAHPPTVLAVFAQVLLALAAVLALVTAGVRGWAVLSYAGSSHLQPDQYTQADVVTLWLVLANAGLNVLIGLTFVSWLFIACKNTRLYGVWTRRGPGWAIGAWLIPIISLWWPKQIVDDVLRASRPGVPYGTDIRRLPKAGVVTAWWTCWLLSGVLVSVSFGAALTPLLESMMAAAKGEDPSALIASIDVARVRESQALWLLWSSVASCVSACLAILIVHQVTRSQVQRRRELNADLIRSA